MKIFIITLSVLYVSIVLSIIGLCLKNKVKYLCFIAPIIPIFIISINIFIAFRQLFFKNRKITKSIKRFLFTIVYGVTDFPILTVFTVKILAKSALDRKIEEIISRVFNISDLCIFTKSIITAYSSFFTISMKKNDKECIRIKYS
ncbi:MAG: hypothetical protein E6845_07670 [Clostridium sp.]|uniref:hypothetical protein n=1 Tax=Clostridium sp. TaxID=1506 RepID=UPI002902C627|nr:hypothetical protein [Clostridium sp.]MDU1602829.1 hypothetical protein [Clostridium sp.]